jgi:hypothetical protein
MYAVERIRSLSPETFEQIRRGTKTIAQANLELGLQPTIPEGDEAVDPPGGGGWHPRTLTPDEEEYCRRFPLYYRLQGHSWDLFVEDVLAYRRVEPELRALLVAINDALRHKAGWDMPLLLSRLKDLPGLAESPESWLVCDGCCGTGHDADRMPCRYGCLGTGYITW